MSEKAALRQQIADFGPDATAVYAADKVAKVRELRSRATRGEHVLDPQYEPAAGKLKHYLASLSMLEQIAAPTHWSASCGSSLRCCVRCRRGPS